MGTGLLRDVGSEVNSFKRPCLLVERVQSLVQVMKEKY